MIISIIDLSAKDFTNRFLLLNETTLKLNLKSLKIVGYIFKVGKSLVLLNRIKMLFTSVRSLLDGSDTISIDTAVVSSQEFGCLLDMVYTGKLPLGKHNVSRIVAAADNLQMFDVAVGFKNVLTSLVNQQPPVQVLSTQTSNHGVINKAQSVNTVVSASSNKDDSTSDKTEPKTELKKENCQGSSDSTDGPPCKRFCVEHPESSGWFQQIYMCPKHKYTELAF